MMLSGERSRVRVWGLVETERELLQVQITAPLI